ncbi:MAG: hypothetical protein KAW14_00515 [Candidatus Aegiribacteria sp.]|nr:hypothetical protein [Candidatus Aegiribacteria sp.]
MSSLIEKTAILHVHTDASDGTASIIEVIEEARSAHVDILGINDHNTLQTREEGFGGWHDGLYVLVGAELEDQYKNNHLLVYGVDRLPDSHDTGEQIRFVNRSGGICIAAHPTETAGKLRGTRSYPWTLEYVSGLSGVEIWNYMSEWKAGISIFNAPLKLLSPDRYVEHPDPAAVELWEVTGGCAIGGPDAHSFRYGFGPFIINVFPYEMLFGRLRTHILLDRELSDSSNEAEIQLINALKTGRCFISNHLYGDATGFRASRTDGEIVIDLPGKGEIVIERSGRIAGRRVCSPGRHRFEIAADGKFYVSVIREGRTWISCGIS